MNSDAPSRTNHRTLWTCRDGEVIRHSEAGGIPLHPRTAYGLLELFKAQGPWAAEHVRQLSAALAEADAWTPPEPVEDALWTAREMEAV